MRGARSRAGRAYIAVDDVDAYAERVKAAGGAIHRAPDDIPGVGRFSVATDPHGAVFILFKGASDEERQPVALGTPGHVGWHELHAGGGENAFAFYSGLFGWTKAEAIDMGPMGVYQIFVIGGEKAGAMTGQSGEGFPHPEEAPKGPSRRMREPQVARLTSPTCFETAAPPPPQHEGEG